MSFALHPPGGSARGRSRCGRPGASGRRRSTGRRGSRASARGTRAGGRGRRRGSSGTRRRCGADRSSGSRPWRRRGRPGRGGSAPRRSASRASSGRSPSSRTRTSRIPLTATAPRIVSSTTGSGSLRVVITASTIRPRDLGRWTGTRIVRVIQRKAMFVRTSAVITVNITGPDQAAQRTAWASQSEVGEGDRHVGEEDPTDAGSVGLGDEAHAPGLWAGPVSRGGDRAGEAAGGPTASRRQLGRRHAGPEPAGWRRAESAHRSSDSPGKSPPVTGGMIPAGGVSRPRGRRSDR